MALRLLSNETVREFVSQDTGELIGDRRQALNGHANSPIVPRSCPRGRSSNIAKGLLRIKHHGDRLQGCKTELGLNAAEVVFQRVEDLHGKLRRRRSLIVEREVAGLPAAKAVFGFFVRLGLFEQSRYIRFGLNLL